MNFSEELWASLTSQLREMEEQGKVDLSVLPTVESLVRDCQENESWWIRNTIEPIENNFAPYHALRNIRLILTEMEDRFQTAKMRNSNPLVLEKGRELIPSLSSLHIFVSSLKNKLMTNELKRSIYIRSREVRDKAFLVDMLPSANKEISEVDKRRLKSRISRLSKTVQEEFEI